jgi:Kef-type K+ transport system membrane component KefB
MTNLEFGSLALALMLVIGSANLAGYLFARIGQPRIVGEILAGILIGPMFLSRLAPSVGGWFGADGSSGADVLGFLYHLGLLLLMFVSGSAARRVLAKENWRPTAWLLICGTTLPFLFGLGLARFLPLPALSGPHGGQTAVALVFAIAVSVTSIPVISHIFNSLGIIHTRFASLVLGVAVLEDIVLWAVLALATALSAGAIHGALGDAISIHVGTTIAYLAAGLFLMPPILRFLSRSRWNLLVHHSPISWSMTVLLAYVGIAGVLDVTLAFSGFLAGFGVVGGWKATERTRFAEPLDLIAKFSFATFIPVYTCLVGYRLDFTRDFSVGMLVIFLVGSSLIRLAAVGVASHLGGFRGRDVLNLAVTSNARGGPGIVLASVAFDAGIINAPFFTSLVVTAIVTSQFAGWWLGYTIRRGWPLLSDSDLRRHGTSPEGITNENQDPVHVGPVVVATGSHHGA